MFEFLLSIRVSFWLVRVGRIPRRCAATLSFFEKRDPYAQFPFFSSWRRRCGGRSRSNRYLSWLIGVECFVERKVPKDPSTLILRRIKRMVICACMRCLPAFNGAYIHWGRRNWRRDRGLRRLGAILFIRSNYCHSSQHIERFV